MSVNPNQTTAQRVLSNQVQTPPLAKLQMQANSAEERKKIRANATSLSNPQWDAMDDAVFGPMYDQLVLAQAFEGAGLTYDAQYWQTETFWQTRGSGFTDAEHTMDLRTASEEDSVTYGREGCLLPLIHKDYRYGDRELEKSRQTGEALDTTYAAEAGRQVAELVEDTILYGAPDLMQTTQNGGQLGLKGLLNHGARETIAASGDWATGANARADLQSAINALRNAGYPEGGTGYWLLHGTDIQNAFDEPYDETMSLDTTVRDRVEDFSAITRIMYVPRLPDGNAILLQPTERVIDIARMPGGPFNDEWTTNAGHEVHNKVWHMSAPRLKQDVEGNLGVAHISGA